VTDELLDTEAVARIAGLSPVTLRKWRMTGAGPRFVRLGRAVRYRKAAVDAFLLGHEYTTTTEADTAGRD
jgi:predicted DNA-binding transcriptional regulator AlpA